MSTKVRTGTQLNPVPGGVVASVVAGTGISVDDTDPANPVVSASAGGGAWTTVTVFHGNFGDDGGGAWPSPQYLIDGTTIRLRGRVFTGGASAGSMFTLPVHPSLASMYLCPGNASVVSFVEVDASGDVVMDGPLPSTWVDLSPITFVTT